MKEHFGDQQRNGTWRYMVVSMPPAEDGHPDMVGSIKTAAVEASKIGHLSMFYVTTKGLPIFAETEALAAYFKQYV